MRWKVLPFLVAGAIVAGSAGVVAADHGGAALFGQTTVSGTVASVSGSVLQVDTSHGGAVTVDVSGSTQILAADHQALSSSYLVAGERVTASGQESAGVLDASRLRIQPVEVTGTVSAANGTMVTVQTNNGTAVDVNVAQVVSLHPTGATIGLGDRVQVQGVGAGGHITALSVTVAQGKEPKQSKQRTVTGVVGALATGAFTLDIGSAKSGRTVTVQESGATQISGGMLQPGERVRVSGTLNGSVVQATAVRILQTNVQGSARGTLAVAGALDVQTAQGTTITVTVPAGASVRASGLQQTSAGTYAAQSLKVQGPGHKG